MSNYITEINGKEYFAIDDYFGNHKYGYIEKKENEDWENLDLEKKRVFKFNEIK